MQHKYEQTRFNVDSIEIMDAVDIVRHTVIGLAASPISAPIGDPIDDVLSVIPRVDPLGQRQTATPIVVDRLRLIDLALNRMKSIELRLSATTRGPERDIRATAHCHSGHRL